MLTVMRDFEGRLQAACEWWTVDDQGWWEPRGRIVFINNLEVNKGLNLHRFRRYLTEEIGRVAPDATAVYWNRDANIVKRDHAFKRSALQQLRQGVMV